MQESWIHCYICLEVYPCSEHGISEDFINKVYALAEKHCKEKNDDWNTMHSGHQQAEIEAFVDGYMQALQALKDTKD